MNYNKLPQSNKPLQVVLFALICLMIVGGIIFMKSSSSEQRALNMSGKSSDPHSQVAVPDTTVSPDVMPITPDTVVTYVLADTLLGKDKRDPYEAGYEDGYLNGCDDGATGLERASFDESNNYHSQADREAYVKGYNEGYVKGVDDGRNGNQFNIK